MAKSRKRVFPKKPERLNSKTAEKLGLNSNKGGYVASYLAIYKQEPRKKDVSLSDQQKRQLENLRKNLGYTYQRQE